VNSTGTSPTGGARTGGAPATGGALATGGKTSTGGTSTTGGSANGGGNSATGGVTPIGGQSSVGGFTMTGGSATTGGSSNAGGSGVTGGKSSTGGSASTGGKSSTGGTSGNAGSSAYHPCPTDGSSCKIMPFGDSITDGYNTDTPGGYRVELFRRIHSGGKNITFVGSGYNGPDTVDGVAFPHSHEGHSGWAIDAYSGRSGISSLLTPTANSVMTKYTPHIVLLMIGTNDAIDNHDMTNAPTRLGTLIDTIYTQLPNVLIIVAQPIPSRGDSTKGDDTALSARLKTYGDAISGIASSRAATGKHILVVDMYTPFTPKATLIEDQWHPNLAGYVVMGTQWYSVLQPLL